MDWTIHELTIEVLIHNWSKTWENNKVSSQTTNTNPLWWVRYWLSELFPLNITLHVIDGGLTFVCSTKQITHDIHRPQANNGVVKPQLCICTKGVYLQTLSRNSPTTQLIACKRCYCEGVANCKDLLYVGCKIGWLLWLKHTRQAPTPLRRTNHCVFTKHTMIHCQQSRGLDMHVVHFICGGSVLQCQYDEPPPYIFARG